MLGVKSVVGSEQRDINTIPSIMAMVFVSCLPSLVVTLIPMLVGGMVISLGFTEEQGGYVTTADMGGYTLGTIATFFFIHRVNWRLITLRFMVLMVLLNLASGMVSTLESMLILRLLSGISGGILTAVTFAAMGQLRNADSAYGLWMVYQAVLGGAGSITLPYVIERWDVGAGFIIFASLLFAGCLLYRFIPVQARTVAHSSGSMNRAAIKPTGLGILGILVLYIGIMSVYTYLERIGVASGLSQADVGLCFLVMTAIGLIGGFMAAKYSVTFGRAWPVFIGVIGMAGSYLLLMADNLGFFLFMFAASLFFCMWCYLLPYVIGALTAVDPSGRAVALGNGALGIGLTLGPFIATFLLGNGNYDLLLMFGIGFVVPSFILMQPLLIVSHTGITQKLRNRTA